MADPHLRSCEKTYDPPQIPWAPPSGRQIMTGPLYEQALILGLGGIGIKFLEVAG